MLRSTDAFVESLNCPGSFNCSAREGRTSFDIGPVPTYVSIFSSSLSCLGSLLIFVVYYVLPKRLRTGVQTIITLLAIADFVTAIGYLFAAGNFLSHYNVRDASKCDTFQTLCEIQSFVTTWSSLCSYAWTNILAVHFYLKIVQQQTQRRDAKLIPIYNIVAWGGPLLIMIPLLATGKLGFSPYVASNWCYVADTSYKSTTLKQDAVVIVVLLVAGELWVLITYLVAAGLYIVTSTHLRVQRQYMQLSQQNQGPQVAMVENVEKRLLYIPLMFILLRIWGSIQFFFSLAVDDDNQKGCIPNVVHTVFFVLGILQAAGDGGQGWGNALLYIFLSPTMRTMVFCNTREAVNTKPQEQNGLQTVGAQHNHYGSNTTNTTLGRRRVHPHPPQSYSHTYTSECGPSDEACRPTPGAAASPSCETITSSMSAGSHSSA